jgi:hypothetical protein
LLASVGVKVFPATEVHSSLDVSKVKYNIRRLAAVGKEKVVARLRPSNFKASRTYRSHAAENKHSIKKNSWIFSSIRKNSNRSTKFILKTIMFGFPVKRITLVLLT